MNGKEEIKIGLYFPHIREDHNVGAISIQALAHWLEDHPQVTVLRRRGYPFLELADLIQNEIDGLLCVPATTSAVRKIKALKVPTISLAQFHPQDTLPHVREDNAAIGRLAAEYFLKRGFHNFGIINRDDVASSANREEGFRSALTGHQSDVYTLRGRGLGQNWDKDCSRIRQWLQQLPLPVAVMANTDHLGRIVIEMALELGLHVPNDVAVLGVGNRMLECSLTKPTLSSIPIDLEKEMTIALDKLLTIIQTKEPFGDPILVPPLAVVSRESTEVYCFEDARINAVVEFIRQEATSGISIDQVLEKFPMSRRSLETRFKKVVGRTPYEEIQAIQVNEAVKQLRETKESLTDIAEACGFTDVNHMGRVFRARLGKSPSLVRQEAFL